jgi:hypothetical protein
MSFWSIALRLLGEIGKWLLSAALPVAVTLWLLFKVRSLGQRMPLPERIAVRPLERTIATWTPAVAAAVVVLFVHSRPGMVWVSAGAAWLVLGIAALNLATLFSYFVLVLRLRVHPERVRRVVVCTTENPTGASIARVFLARVEARVAPPDLQRFLVGDLRKVDYITPEAAALIGMTLAAAREVPHVQVHRADDKRTILPKSLSAASAPLLNRALNTRLTDAMWETSRNLVRRQPRMVAHTWKTFHEEETVQGRLDTLFSTAELLQRVAGSAMFAVLRDTGRLRDLLGDESERFLRNGSFGDWNGPLRRVLGQLTENEREELAPLATAFTRPLPGFQGELDLLKPFWELIERPEVQDADALSALRLLGYLRNRTIGHGAVGWRMTVEPEPFLSALHRFLLFGVVELAALDLGVCGWKARGNHQGCDRGLGATRKAGENSLALAFPLPRGMPVYLNPYLRFREGALLVVNRIREPVEYVNYSADASQPAFVSISTDVEQFLTPQELP